MKCFYFSKEGKEIYYIPSVLVSTICRGEVDHLYHPNLLETMNLSIINGKITRNSLEERNWEVWEVDVPDNTIRKFANAFSNPDEDVLKVKCDRFLSYVLERFQNIIHDNEDDEDYKDDWWKRGESWSERWKR